MKRLHGKVALITGGAGGIGTATARLFIAEGACVVLADIQEAALQACVKDIGGEAISYVVTDVTNEAQMQKAVDTTLERHGRLDNLFANAGTEGRIVPLISYDLADFQKVLNINVIGVFLGLKYTIPVMQKQGSGSIIITSSISGLKGTSGLSAYATSKHALVGLMRSAALETARFGVRVNTIHPAPIETKMMRAIESGRAAGDGEAAKKRIEATIPMRRYGTAAEVAQLALFLASDDSQFCTGGCYSVDGGLSAG